MIISVKLEGLSSRKYSFSNIMQSTANKKLPEIFNVLAMEKQGGKITEENQKKIKEEIIKYIDISDVRNSMLSIK